MPKRCVPAEPPTDSLGQDAGDSCDLVLGLAAPAEDEGLGTTDFLRSVWQNHSSKGHATRLPHLESL